MRPCENHWRPTERHTDDAWAGFFQLSLHFSVWAKQCLRGQYRCTLKRSPGRKWTRTGARASDGQLKLCNRLRHHLRIRFHLAHLLRDRLGRQKASALWAIWLRLERAQRHIPTSLGSILLFAIGDPGLIKTLGKKTPVTGIAPQKRRKKAALCRLSRVRVCCVGGGGQQLAFDWTGNQCGSWADPPSRIWALGFASRWLKLSVKYISDDKQKANSARQRVPLHPHASMRGGGETLDFNSPYWAVWARRTHKSGLTR